MWTWRTDVTAYYDGKPFYCLNSCRSRARHTFMCSKYDFMAESRQTGTGESAGGEV